MKSAMTVLLTVFTTLVLAASAQSQVVIGPGGNTGTYGYRLSRYRTATVIGGVPTTRYQRSVLATALGVSGGLADRIFAEKGATDRTRIVTDGDVRQTEAVYDGEARLAEIAMGAETGERRPGRGDRGEETGERRVVPTATFPINNKSDQDLTLTDDNGNVVVVKGKRRESVPARKYERTYVDPESGGVVTAKCKTGDGGLVCQYP